MASGEKKRVDVFKLRCYLLSTTTQDIMDVEENEQAGVEQDWVCFGVDKGYGGEKDQVTWTNRPKKQHGKSPTQGKMEGKRRRGIPAKTRFQDVNNWTKPGGCIPTGKRSGKMAGNHQSQRR